MAELTFVVDKTPLAFPSACSLTMTDCTAGNIASERVMLKCGFQLEGVWREQCWEHGRFVDIKQFGLLRREYRGKTSAPRTFRPFCTLTIIVDSSLA